MSDLLFQPRVDDVGMRFLDRRQKLGRTYEPVIPNVIDEVVGVPSGRSKSSPTRGMAEYTELATEHGDVEVEIGRLLHQTVVLEGFAEASRVTVQDVIRAAIARLLAIVVEEGVGNRLTAYWPLRNGGRTVPAAGTCQTR